MAKEALQFVLAFCAGMLWYRFLFFLVPIYFKRPLTRSLLKLHWHHLHWGILLMLTAAILLLFLGKNTLVIILLGLGLGFCMDLFIPSLLLETNREQELIVYGKSLIPTILLFLFIAAAIIALSFFKIL
jgi:branched-subunit amino acid transport protein